MKCTLNDVSLHQQKRSINFIKLFIRRLYYSGNFCNKLNKNVNACLKFLIYFLHTNARVLKIYLRFFFQMQTKSTTQVDDYQCKLSLETRKIAENELRETDEIRTHSLKSLREWVDKNPRIVSMRLDSNFLLRFLRCRKFSLPMTKDMIERYLVLRHYEQDEMKIFQNFDMRLPAVKELFELG